MAWATSALAAIDRMYSFQTFIGPELEQALDQAADIVIEAARGNMHWQNPSGNLSASIVPIKDTPYEIKVGSALPYAARRHWGFSGADSRGRIYTNDQGNPFLEQARDDNMDQIKTLIQDAIDRAWRRLAGF